MNGMFDLAIILRDVSDYLFREAKPTCTDLTKVDTFYQRLQQWAENLAECIKPVNIPSPGAIEMQ
jgi:hypothetical protein